MRSENPESEYPWALGLLGSGLLAWDKARYEPSRDGAGRLLGCKDLRTSVDQRILAKSCDRGTRSPKRAHSAPSTLISEHSYIQRKEECSWPEAAFTIRSAILMP